MKPQTSWVLAGLFILVATQNYASPDTESYPEAYAGLSKDAYHRIEFNQNKSTEFGFQIQETQVSVQLDGAKSTAASATNLSFTQTLPNGSISATKGTNSLFGQMHLNNKHYILTTNQAGIWAVELPATGLRYNDCGVDHSQQTFNQKINNSARNQTNSKVAGTVIDVLVIYDQAFANRYPGELLQTRVDQYFNVSNQTYANSELDLAIRQVGLNQVGYNFNNENLIARDTLYQTLVSGFNTQGFGNVPQLRAETGADLVIFLRTHNIETRGNCGIAFFPFSNNGINFDADFGINIMADGMSSWSICTDQLMVHEIGHNLGAGHQNVDPPQYGFPEYAKGFAKLGQFGTVMGSFGTGDPNRFLELNYFSNPNVRCGGGPCGITGQRNNANIINQLKGPISSYKNSISNAPNPADFTLALTDQDGDGVLDRDDEFPFDGTETTDSDGDGVGDVADDFPNQASEQSDFDGDGIGNNADNDDDNDGILDFDDDFPLNSNEVKDSDGDGVGDIADDFVFNKDEFIDYDQDAVGDNADDDDDNDGLVDLSNDKQDLLVINTGNNRILRFDAQTGLAKGIEVLPDDGLLTFQSDLSYDQQNQRLYYSTQSSIKTLDLMKPYAKPELAVPPFSNSLNGLGTGFPTALEVYQDDSLYLGKLDVNSIDRFNINNFRKPLFSGATPLPGEEPENIIDLEVYNGELFTLGQSKRLYRGNPNCCDMALIGNSRKGWLTDPYAFVVTDEEILIHTDQSRNKLVMTDGITGGFAGIFADLATLGYSNPTGIEITKDGRLLVAVSDQDTILAFNLEDQSFIGELVKGFGMDRPHKMLLVPQLQDRFHQDVDKTIRPNEGNWFNPATSGRGFSVVVAGNRLQVLWFTYDEQGLPIWYTSAGLLNGFNYQADLLKTNLDSEGAFSFQTIGQLNVEFSNEREAFMSWQIGENSGEEPIFWLQSSGEPEVENYTGMWSRPDTPGWGVAVSTIGEKSFAIPFIYDDAGEPRWAVSDVFTGVEPLQFDMSTNFSEGLCPSCSGPISTTFTPSGNMTLNLSDNNSSWSSAIIWADPIPGDWLLEQTEIIRISSEPTRPR